MVNRSIDALNHSVMGPFPRRLALLVLGTAGLGAIVAPGTTQSRRKNKKRNKKPSVGEKARQKCEQQVEQCVGFFSPICDGNPDCSARIGDCCTAVGTCDVVGFFTCLNTV